MKFQSRLNIYIVLISGLLMFASGSVIAQDRAVLQSALGQIDRGQYAAGAATLFTLSNRPEYANDRPQIKYILGMALMRLNMPQVAAFQFVDVIRTRDAKYTRMAVEKLSLVADELGDDTILSYVLNQIHLNEVPANEKDMVLYRLGEAKLAADDFASAIDLLSKVAPESSYYELAQVKRGLAQMESGRVDDAIVTFKGMIAHRPKASPNDENMVAARMGIARALYQKKSWDAAIEAYSLIPRDSLEWHNAVYEKAWAMVQAVRFRSAMGLFQTMHSAFYEDHYNPESLLLRAIVYLYICKYDELDKVISLFEKSYGPVRRSILVTLKNNPSGRDLYNDLERAQKRRQGTKNQTQLPYIVLRHILLDGDVSREMTYLELLNKELALVSKHPILARTGLGRYSAKILVNRMNTTKSIIGDSAKARLFEMKDELKDLFEKTGFVKVEKLSGKKTALKQKMDGKAIETNADDGVVREFLVKNGYQYYPYQREQLRDELGDIHYLGKRSCEQ